MGSCRDGAQDALELGKGFLDGIEVRAVGREIKQPGVCLLDGLAHTRHLVDGQVVHDDDIAFFQRGAEDFFDVDEKQRAVHRPVDGEGRGHARFAQGGDERQRLPAAKRLLADEPFTPQTAPVAPRHARVHARFVDEDQIARAQLALFPEPPAPVSLDVRPVLLAGVHRFFYSSFPCGSESA